MAAELREIVKRSSREFLGLGTLFIVWAFYLKNAFRSGLVFTMSPDNEYDLAQMFSAISSDWKSGVIPLRLDDFMLGFPIYNWSSMTPWYPFYGFFTSNFSNFESSIQSMSNLVALHILIAMFNMYYFMRTLRSTKTAAVLSATLFGLSADMFNYSIWLIIVAPYAWFPLVIAGSIKILRDSNYRLGIPLVVISFVLMILASPSQPIIHVTLFVLVISGIFFLDKKQGTLPYKSRKISILLASCCTAGLITMPVLLPQALNLREWIRWIGNFDPITLDKKIPFPAFDYWRLKMENSSQILFNVKLDMVGSSFVGVAVIVLALISFGQKLNFAHKAFFVVSIYGLLSAFGSELGLGYLNYHIPLINAVREPTRHLFLFQFAIAALAGIGLDHLRKLNRQNRTKRDDYVLGLSWLFGLGLTSYGLTLDRLTLELKSLLIFFLAVLLLIIFPAAKNNLYGQRVLWSSIPILVLFFHYSSVDWTPPYKLSESEYSQQTFQDLDLIYKKIESLDVDSNYRAIIWGDIPKGFAGMHGTYRNVRTTQYYLNPAPIMQAVDVDYNDAGFAGFSDLKFKYFSLIGAKYYICDLCDEIQNQGYKFSKKIGKFSLYINSSAKPLIYSAVSTKNVMGRMHFLEKLRVLDRDTILVESTESELTFSGESPCKTEIMAKSSIYVNINLNCTSRGIVVLNEYYDGNWRAYLNGKSVHIHQSNVNQNGVFISPGMKKLEFKYQPADFRIGSLISIFSLFLVILLLVRRQFLGRESSVNSSSKERYRKKRPDSISLRNRKS